MCSGPFGLSGVETKREKLMHSLESLSLHEWRKYFSNRRCLSKEGSQTLNLTVQLSPTIHLFLRNPSGLPQLVVFVWGAFISPIVNDNLCTLLSLQIQKEMIIKYFIYYFIRKIKESQRTNYNFKSWQRHITYNTGKGKKLIKGIE